MQSHSAGDDFSAARVIHSGTLHRQLNRPFWTDDLIDELPVEKRHLSKLIIICRI